MRHVRPIRRGSVPGWWPTGGRRSRVRGRCGCVSPRRAARRQSRAPSFSLVFSGDRVSAWGWGRDRRAPGDAVLGLQVDLFALGAALPHVVAEVDLQGRPGLACGDAYFARRLRAAAQVFGDLAGSPRDHQAAIVVAERGNGTQPLFQVVAGELEFNSQNLAGVAEFHDVALHVAGAVELDARQVGNEALQARAVGTGGLSHRRCPFGWVMTTAMRPRPGP